MMLLRCSSVLVSVCVRLVDFKSKRNLTYFIPQCYFATSLLNISFIDIVKIFLVAVKFGLYSEIHASSNIKMTRSIFFLELVGKVGIKRRVELALPVTR